MNYFQIKFPLISNILWTHIRNIYSILLEVLQFYLVFILLFQTFRILIYFNYSDLFTNLHFFEFIQSIFLGLRFDLSSISAILFIPIVFYIIPFNFSNSLSPESKFSEYSLNTKPDIKMAEMISILFE